MRRHQRANETFTVISTGMYSIQHVDGSIKETIEGSSEQRFQRHVLIVDDNEDSLMLARYIVEDKGYDVVAHPSGHGVIDVAIAYRPDLVLLDIALGKTSGIDIFHQLKQQSQLAQVPVVAVTALAQSSVKEEAIAIGFSDYLLKPYRVEALAEIVEKYCACVR